MTLVIDASVACKWFFEEPLSAEARALAEAGEPFSAPDLIVVGMRQRGMAQGLGRDGSADPGTGVSGIPAQVVRVPGSVFPHARTRV